MGKNGLVNRIWDHFRTERAHRQNERALRELAETIFSHKNELSQPPVIFFDASTRLGALSLNAGFASLASRSLELQGVPVVHFVCRRGMSCCVLGTDRDSVRQAPPCEACVRFSDALFSQSNQVSFEFQADPELEDQLKELDFDSLSTLTWQGLPLGELVLPSLRWILRRHHVNSDEITLSIFRHYIRSAWQVAKDFTALLETVKPSALVVYNGVTFPEATARWIARKQGIRVISHEVGLRPVSAYFTEGEATAYDLDIPDDFQLSPAQNERLDKYLGDRFKGNFQMAGVKFWPEMSDLSPEFVAYARQFTQVVPVFTNVIFDTSQVTANVVFNHMFDWLDNLLAIARAHPETLFVIRAHPDEARVGKASLESVADWAHTRGVEKLANIRFIPPLEFINSYDLIRMAKFVMVYNSTIGLEAAILGAGVLSAGKARYTASDVVWLPRDREAYQRQVDELLSAETVEVPAQFRTNARRFLYWQLYRSSLSFADFLEPDGIWDGYVRLKTFEWQKLLPENNPAMAAITDGILSGGDFMLREDS